MVTGQPLLPPHLPHPAGTEASGQEGSCPRIWWAFKASEEIAALLGGLKALSVKGFGGGTEVITDRLHSPTKAERGS